jgi:hypothetical protein
MDTSYFVMQIASTAHFPIQKSAFDMAASIGSDFNSDTDEHMSIRKSINAFFMSFLS